MLAPYTTMRPQAWPPCRRVPQLPVAVRAERARYRLEDVKLPPARVHSSPVMDDQSSTDEEEAPGTSTALRARGSGHCPTTRRPTPTTTLATARLREATASGKDNGDIGGGVAGRVGTDLDDDDEVTRLGTAGEDAAIQGVATSKARDKVRRLPCGRRRWRLPPPSPRVSRPVTRDRWRACVPRVPSWPGSSHESRCTRGALGRPRRRRWTTPRRPLLPCCKPSPR